MKHNFPNKIAQIIQERWPLPRYPLLVYKRPKFRRTWFGLFKKVTGYETTWVYTGKKDGVRHVRDIYLRYKVSPFTGRPHYIDLAEDTKTVLVRWMKEVDSSQP